MTENEYETVMGPDGRVWWRIGRTDCWQCRRDGTLIQSLDDLLPSGETKAEANLKRLISAGLDRIVYGTGTIDKGGLTEAFKDKS